MCDQMWHVAVEETQKQNVTNIHGDQFNIEGDHTTIEGDQDNSTILNVTLNIWEWARVTADDINSLMEQLQWAASKWVITIEPGNWSGNWLNELDTVHVQDDIAKITDATGGEVQQMSWEPWEKKVAKPDTDNDS